MSAFLKLISTGIWRQAFICPKSPIPSPPPLLHTVWICTYLCTNSDREGGWTSEKARGALVHKRGRKYQPDWLYLQSLNSITPQVKKTFRVWCLYRYLVHALRSTINPCFRTTCAVPDSVASTRASHSQSFDRLSNSHKYLETHL